MRYQIDNYGAAPVTLAEAKNYLKVANTDDDEVIQTIINSVAIFAERHTGRSLRANEWLCFANSFSESLDITKRPVETIDEVQYVTTLGSAATVAPSVYEVCTDGVYQSLVLKSGQSWPTDVREGVDSVLIKLTTRPDRRAAEVKVDMLKHIAHDYENRGDDEKYNGYDVTEFYDSSSIPKF